MTGGAATTRCRHVDGRLRFGFLSRVNNTQSPELVALRRVVAEPPMQWSTEQSYPPERRESENVTAQSTGWQITRSASSYLRSPRRARSRQAFILSADVAMVASLGGVVASLVRAHANRESPKPAARPFPVGSCSLSRCCHVCPSVANMVHGNHLERLNGVRGRSLDELSGKHASSTRALAARIGIDLGRWWSMPLAKY